MIPVYGLVADQNEVRITGEALNPGGRGLGRVERSG